MSKSEITRDVTIRERTVVITVDEQVPPMKVSPYSQVNSYRRVVDEFHPDRVELRMHWQVGTIPSFVVIVSGPHRDDPTSRPSRAYWSDDVHQAQWLPQWLSEIVGVHVKQALEDEEAASGARP